MSWLNYGIFTQQYSKRRVCQGFVLHAPRLLRDIVLCRCDSAAAKLVAYGADDARLPPCTIEGELTR